ncbi:MAG: TldD/PmbA family protein [candidate division NC10 bacterium]|nr:TldD/PmbA family protein [candidate division NC10 bacterium]
MTGSITAEVLDRLKPQVASQIYRARQEFRGLVYADLRLEVREAQAATAENGQSKEASRDATMSFGIRALAGGKILASGYYGRLLGAKELATVPEIVREGLRRATARAKASATQKMALKRQMAGLAKSLTDTVLAPIPVRQETIPGSFQIDPRSVPLSEIIRHTTEVSRAVAGLDSAIRYNQVTSLTQLTRHLFVSSEGALIDQSSALTEGSCNVVAARNGVVQEDWDAIGDQRGFEVLLHGVADELIRFPDLATFAVDLARETVALCTAPPCPTTRDPVVVVTDPHFNALLCHEIIGHPTELDRALKMETAYAGRSWLLQDLAVHQIGRQIASPAVTAYSDPGLPGYGHYRYDDEGTPGKRVTHIDHGNFQGFMNSRQTAAILGAEPNGHAKATEAFLVPLIRMSNTVFAPGDQAPQDIIREVETGYYVEGHKIPSIAESRENFRISARKVYAIRHGELRELYRDGGIMADSKDYLMSIDAVGNDFRLFPIANCGKGQPMQTKRVGNGGPTMRGLARLTGGGG